VTSTSTIEEAVALYGIKVELEKFLAQEGFVLA
jgi:hypothetical protein